MLNKLLRLYTASMAGQVTSPVVHLFGPPGCGKSTFVKQLADLVGKRLHTLNVSRISPLELEGVQMPNQGKLDLLLSTYWNNLEDGDIVLLDEFLRGFPEVYNGLLDILTSREVAGHRLPNVFFVAASNSSVTYDTALADRLLNLNVPDPRSNKTEHQRIADVIVDAAGLLPDMRNSWEMNNLLRDSVLPMYEMMDPFNTKAVASTAARSEKIASPRNLIGQCQLRLVTNGALHDVLATNNSRAMADSKPQFVLAFAWKNGKLRYPPGYVEAIAKIFDKLNPIQKQQATLNLQLIKSDQALRKEQDDEED